MLKDNLPLKALIVIAWVVFFSLFFIYIYPIGLISDDVLILKRAKEGNALWTIHFSLILEFLWKALANERLSVKHFKLIALGIHLLNVGLFFRLLVSYFGVDKLRALLGATLFLFSAAGLEAIAWNCCLGYLITAFFLFLSLNITDYFLKSDRIYISFFLATLQILAVITWDFGVIICPMAFAAAFFYEKRPSLKRILYFIAPSAAVILIYLMFRSTLQLEVIYKKNSLIDMAKFFLGSPLLIMLPNMEKSFFSSYFGIVLSLVTLSGLIYLSVSEKKVRPSFAFFVIAILPWLIGGHPSSRYYYLSAPFLYAFVLFLKGRAWLSLILAMQILFFFQRSELWNEADHQSKSIASVIEDASKQVPASIQFVVINVPDAYGPSSLPMRPQVWHCGLEALCDRVTQVKILGTPFVWADSSLFMTRSEIQETFLKAAIFEVVLEDVGKYGSFALIPFVSEY